MSLNQFLAVGRSFVGIRGEKSPFEMKKECLLPHFDGAPRFRENHAQSGAEQGDSGAQPELLFPKEGSRSKLPGASSEVHEIEASHSRARIQAVKTNVFKEGSALELHRATGKRSWLSILTFGLLGRRKGGTNALVQGELKLEKVRVLRNDLSDSDLELVLKKRPQARKASAAARSWSTVEEQQPWSKLASRLFEIEKR